MKNHPEHQEEIMSNSWKYWQMELDEMIDKFWNEKTLPSEEKSK